jgi:hypothetical protein
MVEQVTFQTLFQFLQTVGILVGVSYYIMSLRNQAKARQIQTFQIIMNPMSDVDIDMMNEVQGYQWDDYHDFEMKYGSSADQKAANKRYKCWNWWDGVGYMLKKGWIDRDMVLRVTSSGAAHWMWYKFEPVIKEIRVRYNMPFLGVNWEYLVEEHNKMYLERGFSPEPPEEYGKYIPDQ